jgi:branched-chain amino acid transport system substrate-binding protein
MMKPFVSLWIIAVIALLPGRALAQDIIVDVPAPITGPFAALGHQVITGAEAATTDINSRGGVLNGRRIVLRILDDPCTNRRVDTSLEQAVAAAPVAAVLGPLCRVTAMVVSEIYQRQGVLEITESTVPELTNEAARRGWTNIFRIVGRDDIEAQAAATYLISNFRNRRLAIIRDGLTYGNTLASGLEPLLRAAGIVPVFEGSIEPVQLDFSPILEQVRRVGADVIYFAGSTLQSGQLVRRARLMGLGASIVTGGPLPLQEFWSIAGESGTGTTVVSMMEPRELPAAQSVVRSLSDRGITPSGYTLFAYAALQVFAQAIDRAGSVVAANVSQALKRETFETVLGATTFDENGDLKLPYAAYRWEDGRAINVATLYPPVFAQLPPPAPPAPPPPIVAPPSESPPKHRHARAAHGKTAWHHAPSPAVQGVYWNSWFDDDGSPTMVPNRASPTTPSLVLDLSSYEYAAINNTQVRSVAADVEVRTQLAKFPNQNVDLVVVPIALGSEVTFTDRPLAKKLHVTRSRLQRPTSGNAGRMETQLVAAFAAGRKKVSKFAGEVEAGKVEFALSLNRAGCAAVAFVIWTNNGIPLDHLVLQFPVADGQAIPTCDESETSADAFRNGLPSLLDISRSNEAGPTTANAAMQIFETTIGGKTMSTAVFVDRDAYRPPLSNDPTSGAGVYWWKMDSLLSEFVGTPTRLPSLVKSARKSNNPTPYQSVRDALAETIFGTQAGDTEGRNRADAAKRALQRIVNDHPNPVILARLVSAYDEKLYLPLGLLSARGEPPLLSKQITVVQPLMTERAIGGRQCIDGWTFAIPDEMDGAVLTRDALAEIPVQGRPAWESWKRDLPNLKDYMRSARPARRNAPAEGLLLLAHYADGDLWYRNGPDHILPEDIRHVYPLGSIAVLAACSTADPTRSNLRLVETLNVNGIDAMLVSPFEVPVDYAAQLAINFTSVVEEQRQQRKSPTLLELFRTAAAKPSSSMVGVPDEMALEFVIAGNPSLKLCPP